MSITKEEHLKDTVTVLLSALLDKENSVNNVVIKSLCKISNSHPNEVIDIFNDFYKNTTKLNSTQLGNIIKVLDQTCVNQVKKLRMEVATELVGAMLRAMTQNSEYEPGVQMGASSVLVAIGHVHLDLVLTALVNETSSTSVPHYTIPHTLGTLAAVNTCATVPHIKEILSKMLPLLPLVKVEGTKQAFAYAFGHFSVAVSEQIVDNVENGNITAIKENFVKEFSIIFDVLYNQWLHSYEPKAAESVLEALGPITRLISESKFYEIVNKFMLTLLTLYRKASINSYYVSQCISYVLSPSHLNPKLTLNDNVINTTNNTLFNHVLLEPDYDQPHTIKNHFEVLRCFDHMSAQFPDDTIDNLLHHCKNNQEKERMKALIVLTHLTTSSQVFVDKFATKFIGLLKVMAVSEQGLKMKKLIVKAIVGLVYRNCLINEEFSMVEFIVKNCGYVAGPHVSEKQAFQLQDTCKSSLILMCNTVTGVRTQLLNLLLSALTAEEFTSSISTIAACLVSLLQNNSESFPEDCNDNSSSSKIDTDLIFVRSIIYLADPNNTERNKNLLLFLEEYSGDVHKNLKILWTVEVQRLLKHVDKEVPNAQWHSMLLDVLVTAIEQVNSEKWTENLSVALSDQILKTKQLPMIKAISLQYLAIVSCNLSNVAVVENILKILLFSLKSVPMESCDLYSTAVGIASRKHGAYVLNQLNAIYKEIEGKRGSKILNFISSRHSKAEIEMSVVKCALINCYGKVARDCLDVDVLTSLGENVTNTLYEILKANPEMDLCRTCITTLYQIGKALQPASHHNVVLRNRWQILNAVLGQILNPNLEKRNVELYPIIVNASNALTKLQKGILPEERNTILRVLFNSIFGELALFKKKYENEGNVIQNDLLAKTLNDSLTLLHELIRELIIQSTCLSTIDDLVGLLIEWHFDDNEEIRIATVLIFQVVFDAYIKNVKLNYETPSKFAQMGYLLGLIIPGVADTNFQVRLTTMDCVKLIIQIQDLYEGHTVEPQDECMESLTLLNNNILTNDLTMVADYCKALCDNICDKIPHHYTMQFVESLLESFGNHEYRSTGIGAILEALFTKRGLDLYQNIERILEIILDTMDKVPENISQKLLPPIRSIACHHSNAVTAVLLSQRIPLKPCVVSSWRYLACDDQLLAAIVENFLRLMSSIELFEEPYSTTEHRIAALQPLTLISALGEMLEEEVTSELCSQKFPELFSVLFTTLACFMDAEPPAYILPQSKSQERFGFIPNRESIKLFPGKIAMTTLNSFLSRANCHKVKEACLLCLSIEHGDTSSTLLELVPVLTGALCRECPAHISRLVNSLSPYARSQLPPHRCAVLAFFGELLTYRCNNNSVLIETVTATLVTGCKDSNERVRATSLRGVANIAHLSPEHCSHYLPGALAALSQGVDAQATKLPLDNVPLAAIHGLSRLLTELVKVDHEYDREFLSISQKIRPFMNTECVQLREYSIRLFGILASKIKSDTLVEQAVSSLPCFLLHLCDNYPTVIRATKFTLKQVFKTFNIRKANDMVQNHLIDEGKLFIEEFLSALLRHLADEMPQALPKLVLATVNYLHTTREDLKPYSPLLLGTLYAELCRILSDTNDDTAKEVEPDVTKSARNRLLQLVKDPNPVVRMHSAMALGNVCLYEMSAV